MFELVPEFPACGSDGDACSESSQEKVGVSGVADGQNRQSDGNRQQGLKGASCLQEGKPLQQQDSIRDDHSHNDAQGEFLGQFPAVGVRASGNGQEHQDDGQGKAVVKS